MSGLTDRIAEARDIAVEREGDIRLQEFLRAMNIEDFTSTSYAASVSIRCESKGWTRFMPPDSTLQIEAMTIDELADEVASWIQRAFASGMLSISNPPIIYREYGAQTIDGTHGRPRL